jgi:uncharacterized protein (DUF2062 family)
MIRDALVVLIALAILGTVHTVIVASAMYLGQLINPLVVSAALGFSYAAGSIAMHIRRSTR